MTTLVDSHVGARHHRRVWWFGYAAVMTIGLMIAAYASRRFDVPFLGLSLALVVSLLVGWLARPRPTMYAVLFLTAVSDQVTVWWFPFVKRLSSAESIAYVGDAVTISPLELALGIGFVVSVVRHYARFGRLVRASPLTAPVLAFTIFVIYGFARGLMLGGDLRIALLEGRGLFYIALTYVIVVNECTSEQHLRRALAAIIGGVVVQTLLSIEYLTRLDAASREALESLTEHGSSLGHNLVIVTLLCFLLLRVRSAAWRWGLMFAAIPTVFVYLVAQRRAGIAALLVGLTILAIAVYWHDRRRFWLVAPLAAMILVAYTAVFWNSTSSVGFPAQAIKTVVAPGQATEKDQSSDLYRLVETFNLNFTIRTSPLLGIGFGIPFYRPIQLPGINFWDLAAYTPHNSMLWVWLKTGFGGFVTIIYLFGKALMVGGVRVKSLANGPDLVVSLAAAAYVMMFVVYTWVDISWDPRNSVFLGLMLAVCAWPTETGNSKDQDLRSTSRSSEATAATPAA